MTPVEVCNLALRRIGAGRISNLETETSKQAVACQTFYAHSRDLVLAQHDWAFAREVQSLTSLTDDGKTKYDYKYELPSDPYCIQPRRLRDSLFSDIEYVYELMGRAIYTNLDGASLEYTMRVEDPDEWDVLFTETLSWFLAAELIRDLGNKTGVDAAAAYDAMLLEAKGRDEKQKRERKAKPALWSDERFGR